MIESINIKAGQRYKTPNSRSDTSRKPFNLVSNNRTRQRNKTKRSEQRDKSLFE